jgi:predicted phage-related endonuclease
MNDTERAYWLAERAGKLTASRMKDAMDFLKSGKPSEKRSAYQRELLAERLTDLSVRHFVTPAMEWGSLQEDAAWRAFEAATGILVSESRFYDHPTIAMCGATPDREIDHDGLGESKCPTTQTFVQWTINGVVPEECKPQMVLQLACTRRRYCKFIAFDPRIKDERRQLFIRDFEPTREEIEVVEDAARTFLSEVETMWEQLTTRAA